MKKNILKSLTIIALSGILSGCGNSFLETDYYKGIDSETGLNSVANISTALNGTYDRLFRYNFAGNYAVTIGDVPTDISYWNTKTGHWDDMYQFNLVDTDVYLRNIWEYGYKVADNAARVIVGAEALYGDASEKDKKVLDRCLAEAYALRGYSQLILTNVFGHQVKVAGKDFSSSLGIVVIDQPIEAFAQVSRSTVGQSYDAVLSDFTKSLKHFDAAGGDRGVLNYMGVAAVNGLMARTYLYLENWTEAKKYAQAALTKANIKTLAYGDVAYKALYFNASSNDESMFALAITSSQNWSANSCGTLWSTYNFSPSPKLLSMYGAEDCRTSIFGPGDDSTPSTPTFNAGKFANFESGNPAYGTNYLVNAPEMFLIIAESELNSGTIAAAQESLLVVAKRNAVITSVTDLPSAKSDLLAFLQDERARELFQEGMRLWDLRRWGNLASIYAYNAPDIKFTYDNYQISDLLFPIPVKEVNAGFGVQQNDWASTLPK